MGTNRGDHPPNPRRYTAMSALDTIIFKFKDLKPESEIDLTPFQEGIQQAQEAAQNAIQAADSAQSAAENAKVPFVVCTLSGNTINGAKLGAVNLVDLADSGASTYIADVGLQLDGYSGVTEFIIKSSATFNLNRMVSIRNGDTVLANLQVALGAGIHRLFFADGNYISSNITSVRFNNAVPVLPDAGGRIGLSVVTAVNGVAPGANGSVNIDAIGDVPKQASGDDFKLYVRKSNMYNSGIAPTWVEASTIEFSPLSSGVLTGGRVNYFSPMTNSSVDIPSVSSGKLPMEMYVTNMSLYQGVGAEVVFNYFGTEKFRISLPAFDMSVATAQVYRVRLIPAFGYGYWFGEITNMRTGITTPITPF